MQDPESRLATLDSFQKAEPPIPVLLFCSVIRSEMRGCVRAALPLNRLNFRLATIQPNKVRVAIWERARAAPLLSGLPQTNPGPATVRRDELDAGGFEGGADGGEGAGIKFLAEYLCSR